MELLTPVPNENSAYLHSFRPISDKIEYTTGENIWRDSALSDTSSDFCIRILEEGWSLDIIISNKSATYRVFMQQPGVPCVGIFISKLSDEALKRAQRSGLSDYDNQEWWVLKKDEVPELISNDSGFYVWREYIRMP